MVDSGENLKCLYLDWNRFFSNIHFQNKSSHKFTLKKMPQSPKFLFSEVFSKFSILFRNLFKPSCKTWHFIWIKHVCKCFNFSLFVAFVSICKIARCHHYEKIHKIAFKTHLRALSAEDYTAALVLMNLFDPKEWRETKSRKRKIVDYHYYSSNYTSTTQKAFVL